jgi:pimeloyl-ACP methyl ester carboxylesterase
MNFRRFILILVLSALVAGVSCREERVLADGRVSDTFYVKNKGASMHVLVEGNSSARVFLLMVHGGPGGSSLFYHTDYIVDHLENHFAVVYWDQRNSGASPVGFNTGDLTLAGMTDDLKKVIQVVKQRYGRNSEIFLLGHSFGGLLTTSFMTTGNDQSLVKGWIFVDGSHNYPLNDTLTRQKLMSVGQQQIALNHHKEEWREMVNWCRDHPGPFSIGESEQLESFASDAEDYMDEVQPTDLFSLLVGSAVKDKWPLTSMLVNYLYSSGSDFNDKLYRTGFSGALARVKVPTLVLFGRYDFICPTELGLDFYNRLGSTDKKMAISDSSGHNMMYQDPAFFCSEITDFIDRHK